MKLFFEICKEFFDLLYLPYVSDIIENEIIREDLDNEELDQEKGYKEDDNQDYYETQDYEYIQNDDQDNHEDIQYNPEKKDIEESIEEDNDDKEICECEFFRQTLSIINARIYKFINDNKME